MTLLLAVAAGALIGLSLGALGGVMAGQHGQADAGSEEGAHDAGELCVEQHVLDEPVFQKERARLVRRAHTRNFLIRPASRPPTGLRLQSSFQIGACLLVDFVGHNTGKEEVAFAAELEYL